MEYYRYDLPNGIRCVHQPLKSAVTYCSLTVNTGSRDELPAEHGLAHLVEHTLFKGTVRRKAYQINSRLENVGGDLNAFTTKEETVLYAATLRRDFSRAAELIADIAFHSAYPEREVEREKEVILDEINSYKDSPVERIYDDFEDRLFAGSSLGHNILGDKRNVTKLNVFDIQLFMKRAYNTDQMVFSSVGAIGERRFREVCDRYWGSFACNERKFSRLEVPETVPFREEQRHRTFQAHCLIGTRAYSIRSPRRIAFLLLINLLGGPSANSLLNVALRERKGLSYTVEAGYTPFVDTGVSTIYFSSDKDKVDMCIELIHKELNRVISSGISPRQFSIAKKQFIGQLLISMENSESNMLSAGKSLLVHGRIDPLPEMIRRIESLTLNDLTEVAREVFDREMSFFIYK